MAGIGNLSKKGGSSECQDLESFAQQMHEVYSTFLNAGFTPDQAMELLLYIAGKKKNSP